MSTRARTYDEAASAVAYALRLGAVSVTVEPSKAQSGWFDITWRWE